ncbi:hypothetical protein J3D47_003242 [Pseudomonas laurylsulfativorans]|nr:hypothetical protein [Pseudomonas laurylsulfativorans]
MVVNDNACLLTKRGALESIASELAPTGGSSVFPIEYPVELQPKRQGQPSDTLASRLEIDDDRLSKTALPQAASAGTQRTMDPVPDCGEHSYKGSGRLADKIALIIGGKSIL